MSPTHFATIAAAAAASCGLTALAADPGASTDPSLTKSEAKTVHDMEKQMIKDSTAQ